jgi:hypothetical protein
MGTLVGQGSHHCEWHDFGDIWCLEHWQTVVHSQIWIIHYCLSKSFVCYSNHMFLTAQVLLENNHLNQQMQG